MKLLESYLTYIQDGGAALPIATALMIAGGIYYLRTQETRDVKKKCSNIKDKVDFKICVLQEKLKNRGEWIKKSKYNIYAWNNFSRYVCNEGFERKKEEFGWENRKECIEFIKNKIEEENKDIRYAYEDIKEFKDKLIKLQVSKGR